MEKLCGFLAIILVIGSTVSGVPLADHLDSNDIPSESEFLNGFNNCAFKTDTSEITSCATERLVRSLDKLAARQNLEILPGVSLLSDGSMAHYRTGKELNDEIEKANANDSSLLELIGNATARLFSGRTLKVKLPDSQTIGRAVEEGRKRMGGGGGGGGKKKGNDMMKTLMSIGGILAAMVPIFLGKVALIATKALIVGKIAFIISGILLFQMFMKQNNNNNHGHGHGHESSWSSSPQISYGPPSASYGAPSTSYGAPSGPYARSLGVESDDAQDMAYSAQK